MKKTILLIYLLFSVVWICSAFADWESTLTLTREESEPSVTIGVGAVAKTLPAPLVLPGENDLYLNRFHEENFDDSFSKDVKVTGESQYCWGLSINPAKVNNPTTLTSILSWNFSEIDEGSFQLREGFECEGDIILTDMSSVQTYSVTGSGTSYQFFSIVYTVGGDRHKINATAGSGGSIDPSGIVYVNEGSDQSFDITNHEGYEIEDVKVDGISQGAIDTYKFEDVSSDRTIHAEFKLIVKPTITVNAPNPVTAEKCTSYTDPGATATDEADGDITDSIVINSNVDINIVGNYQVTYNVTNSAGISADTKTRSVIVVDTTKPIIIINGGSQIIKQGEVYQEFGATAYDPNCNTDLTDQIIVDNDDVNPNIPGDYYVLYSVSDSAGNSSSATRTVRVLSEDEKFQIITTEPEAPKAIIGQTMSFELKYTTSDNNNATTGIGIRIHFNSEIINIDSSGIQDLFETGKAGTPLIKTEDVDDGNPETDKILTMFWSAGFNSNWPNVDLPATLCKLTFNVNAQRTRGEETTINIMGTTTATGYKFFAAPLNITLRDFCLDIDGNGSDDALTDGLLILRYLAGLNEGESLIGSAIGDGATRETWEEIASYINFGKSLLDVDGNNKPDALSDGLLILRYLAGLNQGASLTENAVDFDEGTRITWEEIADYIKFLKCQ